MHMIAAPLMEWADDLSGWFEGMAKSGLDLSLIRLLMPLIKRGGWSIALACRGYNL